MIRFASSLLFIIVSFLCVLAQPQSHPWRDKTVAYLGDSITDPRWDSKSKKYWGWLQDWLGITPYVYAVAGKEWNDIPRQTEALKAEHGNDFDAIIIFIGTNDYNNGVALGTWYDESVENVDYAHHYPKRPELRKRRTVSMNPDTYRGRINIALDSLKRTFPDKQIVLLTPIHRGGFYANDTNWQPGEEYANRIGEYLDAYIEAVREAGNVWALPVIDLASLSGLYPLADAQAEYFRDAETDRLHPNEEGHRRIASTLMYGLQALPCVFNIPE